MALAVTQHPIAKRPSRLGGWLRALEIVVQAALLIGIVSVSVRHWIFTSRLQAELAQMDRTDPGWRLQDIEAARAAVSDDENSALTIVAAANSLRNAWTTKDDVIDDLAKQPPERRLTPQQYAHLTQKLEEAREALEEARRLEHQPQGRFPIVYARNPENTSLTQEQRAREVSFLLFLDVMARTQEGDIRGAMESCRAAVNCGRSLGDEPLSISQIIRKSLQTAACGTLRRVLAQGEPDDADLKSLQNMFDEEDGHDYWGIACRGELASDHAILEAVENGDIKISEDLDGRADWKDRWFPFIREDAVRAWHPQLFLYAARVRAAGEAPPASRRSALHQVDLQMAKEPPNPAMALLASMLMLADRFDNGHAIFRCSAAALAAERYRRAHGDWPQSLDQLVPDYLAAVPTDPFSGNPLLFIRRANGVIVYSVGEDGKDDGGAVDADSGAVDTDNPFLRRADVGVRLWDIAKRRQPPLPPQPPK
jgi:hypothetical protein